MCAYGKAVAFGRVPARRRVDWRLASICTFANLCGALFVFLYLVVVAPLGRPPHGWGPDVAAFVVFAVVAFGFEAWWSTVSWNRVLAWFHDGRVPTDGERASTLRLPLTEAARSYVAWAAIIGGPVNEAARLTELAKAQAGRALASSSTLQRAGDEAQRWSALGTVALRGRTTPTDIYELPIGERTSRST